MTQDQSRRIVADNAGPDIVIVSREDRKFHVGQLYIGVRGFLATNFTVQVEAPALCIAGFEPSADNKGCISCGLG